MTSRPKSLTVAAVLMIIFGAFGIMGALQSLAVSSTPPITIPGADQNPAFVVLQSQEYKDALKIMIIPSIIGGALALTAGIGSLKGRNWGRKLGLFWCLWAMVVGPVGAWITSARLIPVFANMPPPPNMPADQAQMFHSIMQGVIIGAVGGGVLFSVAISITLLILLTRPLAAAWCNRSAQAGAMPPPIG